MIMELLLMIMNKLQNISCPSKKMNLLPKMRATCLWWCTKNESMREFPNVTGKHHMIYFCLKSKSDGKEPSCNAGTRVQILGWDYPPGGGHGNFTPVFLLWKNMDRGAWWARAHVEFQGGLAKITHTPRGKSQVHWIIPFLNNVNV